MGVRIARLSARVWAACTAAALLCTTRLSKPKQHAYVAAVGFANGIPALDRAGAPRGLPRLFLLRT